MSENTCLVGPALDVGIVTSALSDQVRFYSQLLGFPSAGEVEIPGVGTIHRLAAGSSILRLMVPENAPAKAPDAGFFTGMEGIRYLAIRVSDLAELVGRIEAEGFRVLVPTRELRPGVQVAIVADADGNAVELMEDNAS
jgi:catechol 2,3-dioxygenase-like lactoylglutathione lyase family enzyme